MNKKKFNKLFPCRLDGKTVIISGATGGIGKELCRYVLTLGGKLCMLDRNAARSDELKYKLKTDFPHSEITNIIADLEDIDAVNDAVSVLNKMPIDVFIFNAGIYKVERRLSTVGYDNVFTVNCLMPYYITKKLMAVFNERKSRVIIVGSIAHRYSVTKADDIDFRNVKSCELVYGNSKRSLMLGMYELFSDNKAVSLSVCHPGISFTNITAHYPKWLFWLIKYPMKIIFMKPKAAALSILCGCFNNTEYGYWIGPSFFDIWGLPKIKKVKTDRNEAKRVFGQLEEITDSF